MNTVLSLWIAGPALGIAVFVQWAVLRTKYRNELTRQHARHVQQQQTMNMHVQQAKRQIGQLQHDLAAARLQVKRLTAVAAATVQNESPPRNTLARTPDNASQSRPRLPVDGFADTRPFRHSEHDQGLLLR